MILQPVVENAIRHAVSERTEPVQIRISASRRDGRLRLEVQDDGPGLPQGWSLESGAGVGLQNVRGRLAAHFGTAFQLRVQPAKPHGVSVQMEMPFQPAGSS
jgi:LytS/YehU family sensor histidine kinase